MKIINAFFLSWLLGSILFIPGLLVRLGKWKDWYLSPTIPPFAVKRFVYMWIPASLFFLLLPFLAFVPVTPDAKGNISVVIGIVGFTIGIALALWAPGWAKPTWQRRLEDRYNQNEIDSFLRVWRRMNKKEWGRLIETDEGLEELVKMARNPSRSNRQT